ncbi:uncharacterized protein TM35_000411310 [Trypanosoma theileri]|uniref:Uncharacterized protein n=1 Tax=Trypanosoma theileri TaxID=67003 RepID=A0A1X0NJJ0_9TRYP|nr:uncharacterized protein TM35_000411310 [Trypanosoma theileri]ORC84761.1 hypothetical protein TM35_000411310 [Trypanosoma theileri]
MGGSSSKNKAENTAKPKDNKTPSNTPANPPVAKRPKKEKVAQQEEKEEKEKEDVEFKKRLERFYGYYNPTKVSTVPTILSKWTKSKEELIEELVKRYGPEPLDSNDPAAITPCDHHTSAERSGLNEKSPEEINPTIEAVNTETTIPSSSSAAAAAVYENENNTINTTAENVRLHSFRRRLSGFLGVRAPHQLHTLEECLQKYVGKEEELFDFLREAYGVDPSEDEIWAYFIRRLEGLYNSYAPEKVSSAESELADHYGEEDEFLQLIANTLGPDPMLELPAHNTNSQLFEYNNAEVSEQQKQQEEKEEKKQYEIKEGKDESGIDVQHPLPLQDEVKSNSVQDTVNRDGENSTVNAECLVHHEKEEEEEEKEKKGNVTEEVTNMAYEVPLNSFLESSNSAKDEAEKYRRIVEDQQKELAELNEEVQRLRNLLKEAVVDVLDPSQHLSTERGQSYSDPSFSIYKSPNQVEHDLQKKKNKNKNKRMNFIMLPEKQSSQLVFSIPRTQSKNTMDNLLPPPPLSQDLREVSPIIKRPSMLKEVSLFVSRRSLLSPSVSSTKRVRTLAEMRLEYEQELEAIRAAERLLDPYNMSHFGITSPVGTRV